MLVTVTGAQGHIGRAVLPHLVAAGHEVRAIDRTPPEHEHGANVHTVQADVCDHDQLRPTTQGADALVHLAAVASPLNHAGHHVHNTNVIASYNALAAAAEAGIDTVVLASSINAIGGAFSRRARYDYFPVDEEHPTYNEDAYSLSKWISEQQADSFARRHPTMTIASFRIHAAAPDRPWAISRLADTDPVLLSNQLWGYTRLDAIADATLRALQADWHGHEIFNLVAPNTTLDTDSAELAHHWWPEVPLREEFHGNGSFYDCSKAGRVLNWTHP